MPKVGDKEFPYTPKGIQEAAKESSESGIPVQDAGNRRESYQLGGKIPGEQGFGQRPVPRPLGERGEIDINPIKGSPGDNNQQGFMKKGGKVKRLEKRKTKIEKRIKKAKSKDFLKNMEQFEEKYKEGKKYRDKLPGVKSKPAGRIAKKGGKVEKYGKGSKVKEDYSASALREQNYDILKEAGKPGKTKEEYIKAKKVLKTKIKETRKAKGSRKTKKVWLKHYKEMKKDLRKQKREEAKK
jgi:hypothetical protein